MPKIISDEEKRNIVSRLKSAANTLMAQKGVKKTTVDEIVKMAGIPKGSFYLFYKSKELLLFDVSQDYHKTVDEYLSNGFVRIMDEHKLKYGPNMDLAPYVDEISEVILGAMEITYNSCLKALLEPEAMNLVLSKLPPEVLEAHRKEDKGMAEGMFEKMAEAKGLRVEEVVGSFSMILLGGMYKNLVGEENVRGSMLNLIKGMVMLLV